MVNEVVIWFGFFLSIAYLMVVARKSMWLGLALGALILGFFSIPAFSDILQAVIDTLTDPSILFLALGVAIIPIIGGALEMGGLMDDLVNNLRIGKRGFLVFSPGRLATLPCP